MDEPGVEVTPELVDQHNWVYAELDKERRAAERSVDIPEDAVITLTPKFEYEWSGNAEPLLAVLRVGRADADTQKWLAEMIERSADGRGGFAARKTLSERIQERGPLYNAVCDHEDVERLLRARGMKRGAMERAAEIVAMHWGVKLKRVQDYVKLGKADRKRLPKID